MSLNLLGDVSINFIDFAVEQIDKINLNWLGTVVQWIINLVGIVGVGVILFTLILKTVTMPLDIYSRVKMKKQSLLMKKMRPQMEKLQKQYANDKTMYNQKVMELQKENGISMFGACLPMIVTLVIFMVVFSAFSTYSQYANLSMYNDMVGTYNNSVQTYVLKDFRGNTVNENGFLIETIDGSLIENIDVDNLPEIITEAQQAEINKGKAYLVDFDAFAKLSGENLDGKTEADKIVIVRSYVRENARKASADYYREHVDGFLWVGSLWYPDSMLNKSVPDFSGFSSSITRATGSGVDASYEASYNEVSFYLLNEGYGDKVEGNTYNGYFVLIVLAIGLMFLQQFISMRSQKDANELGTVDGSGAKTNKWMMIMMPIIYGAFSFMYSAAFSLYMITSTLYGLISTVVINKVMDISFAKQEANGGYQVKRKKKNERKRLKK